MPIGSIYLSLTTDNPSTLFGGTWERIKDTFLLAAGDTYALGGTGGSIKHTHDYGLQAGGYYRDIAIEQNPYAGMLNYDENGDITVSAGITYASYEAPINNGSEAATKTISMSHFRTIANTSYTSNMPPYLVVYIWKRIS